MGINIIPDVISAAESQSIAEDLLQRHPNISQENLHLTLDDEFRYLDYIPNLYVTNLKHQIGRYAVTMCGAGWYPGEKWHTDGTDDELTFLLYLSGDNNCGGEFHTTHSKNKFELNSLFVLNSSVLHYVTPYHGTIPRIAFKWRYKV